jgi:hypothetical protein
MPSTGIGNPLDGYLHNPSALRMKELKTQTDKNIAMNIFS